MHGVTSSPCRATEGSGVMHESDTYLVRSHASNVHIDANLKQTAQYF